MFGVFSVYHRLWMCFAYCMRLVKGTLLITTKKILIILRLIYKGHGYNYVDFRERERKTESQAVLIGKTPHEHAVTPEDRGGRQILIYSCLQTVKKQSISKELHWAEIYEYSPPQ